MILKLTLILCALFSTPWAQASFETPPLRVLPYEQLGLPPQLHRERVIELLQWAGEGLYLEAFIDMGSMSDFMHMHALFRPVTKGIEKPQSTLTSLGPDYDWSQLELTALLIHTQEYAHLRPEGKFLTPDGRELDRTYRNFVLWNSSEVEPAGTLVRAHEYSVTTSSEPPHTVYASKLDPELFGREGGAPWEYSFYFFRVSCEALERRSSAEVAKTSLVEVDLKGERVCLNLMSFYCRNRPTDQKRCGGGEELTPYYSY